MESLHEAIEFNGTYLVDGACFAIDERRLPLLVHGDSSKTSQRDTRSEGVLHATISIVARSESSMNSLTPGTLSLSS